VTFKPPFPPAAKEYVRQNIDENRSVLAFKVGRLFGYPCTKEGVKCLIRKIKKEGDALKQPVSSSAGYASGY
jgi:hypothetical protein